MGAANRNQWYADWQDDGHVRLFDFRSALSDKNVLRAYESLNEVGLLCDRIKAMGSRGSLLEIGCATGEFYRFLKLRYPSVLYRGVDISRPAIDRALEKYPQARFFLTPPDADGSLVDSADMKNQPDFVYSKDVVHHQTNPLEFLARLVNAATDTVILRCRTRDVGRTVDDPDQSCQYHYQGWMPYIVTNIDELVEHIQRIAPDSEIAIRRNHMILGGQHNRYLPKECYLEETGTAETAVGVYLRTDNPGRVTIEDKPEVGRRYTVLHMMQKGLRLVRSSLSGR